MLTEESLQRILHALPKLSIGVLGDLFLDRYLDIDARLTEPSLETGLDAYQVIRVRSIPGAAGTVTNNLAALGVGKVHVVSIIGDDGEGYELQQALRALRTVDFAGLTITADRRTPTYTKPMLSAAGASPRELNRLDIKNRIPIPVALEGKMLRALDQIWPEVDALIVLDQVSEPNCGVVTDRIRARLAELGDSDPAKPILADSRERIGQFRNVASKPNQTECLRAVGSDTPSIEDAALNLAAKTGRPVFCTCGKQGIILAEPGPRQARTTRVPGYPVTGPIDIVGAGDSTSAAIACAVASGATRREAAAFGCLVASITIQQIGTTGTATPEQIRARWKETQGLD
jgi:bifunctional ADP-heptose synthase (sugar kinase/adenylyltransferase)